MSFDNVEPMSPATQERPVVLVVDDDDGIREGLSEMLEDAGFATVGARHGLEALTLLGTMSAPPTFILLDLMMPIMDGWAFCNSREKSRALSEIPVIVISATDIADWNRPPGVDAFLPKPIDVDRFAWLADRMAGRPDPRAQTRALLH
jgi:CheY-like chemotaxis protein